ncbi:hypothetical protein [Thiolapillus sp.]|uniref:hypothetical protein n=1 Tax=Thiolapillus sp. TaxID=2017437 RepID=UPI0025FBD23B|nr:hypothetical protein [Thiolapillus sp.]
MFRTRQILNDWLTQNLEVVIHPQARTTPKLRAEIKAQRDRKQVDLAKQYNVTPQTIRKWQNRDEFTDKSHRPHRLQTKLSEHQEMLVVLRMLLGNLGMIVLSGSRQSPMPGRPFMGTGHCWMTVSSRR